MPCGPADRNQDEEYSRISFLKGCKIHKDSIVIVSTLPDEQEELTGKAKLFQADSLLEKEGIRRIVVPLVDIQQEAEVKEIVSKLLASKGRALQHAGQWQAMWQSIQVEPTILYLSLACTVAERWKSSDEGVVLAPTVKGIITSMFDRLEKVYGTQLIGHILGFLTFSKTGECSQYPLPSSF